MKRGVKAFVSDLSQAAQNTTAGWGLGSGGAGTGDVKPGLGLNPSSASSLVMLTYHHEPRFSHV